MANFKSEDIDTEISSYAFLPTGSIITMGGPITLYDSSTYTSLGLIPCDGRDLLQSDYPELYSVISTFWNGSRKNDGTTTAVPAGSFRVPNFKYGKVALVQGLSFGTISYTTTHTHTAASNTATWNLNTNTNSADHSHNVNWYFSANVDNDNHNHSTAVSGGSSFSSTAPNSVHSGGDSTASTATLGNHTHTFGVNAGNVTGVNTHNTHYHNTNLSGYVTINMNTGAASVTNVTNESINHVHTGTAINVSSVSSNNSGGTNTNPPSIPYANVLYFIKA
jgi:hypothetical protein